jgi:hypothetical protein
MKKQRPFWDQVEASRVTLSILFLVVGLIAKFVLKLPLANIALAFVFLMLIALGYSIYRIIEDRNKS